MHRDCARHGCKQHADQTCCWHADVLMDGASRAYMPKLHELVGDQGLELTNFVVNMVGPKRSTAGLRLLHVCSMEWGMCRVNEGACTACPFESLLTPLAIHSTHSLLDHPLFHAVLRAMLRRPCAALAAQAC